MHDSLLQLIWIHIIFRVKFLKENFVFLFFYLNSFYIYNLVIVGSRSYSHKRTALSPQRVEEKYCFTVLREMQCLLYIFCGTYTVTWVSEQRRNGNLDTDIDVMWCLVFCSVLLCILNFKLVHPELEIYTKLSYFKYFYLFREFTFRLVSIFYIVDTTIN